MKIKKPRRRLEDEPHALYRFFDVDDELLYIGITANLTNRVEDHEDEKPWWLQVAFVTVEWFGTRSAALAAEAEAIMTECPLYNSQHTRLRGPEGRTCRCRTLRDCGSDRCHCWRESKIGRSTLCCARRQLRPRVVTP